MKKTYAVYLMLVETIFSSFTFANIRNVPGEYPKIQSAIDASLNGDTVLVAPGVYFENIIFRGKKIVVTSTFIYQDVDKDSPFSAINTTMINGSSPSSSDTASCVLIINNEDSTTVLQGFTITGGKGTAWKDEHSPGTYREGGGILTAFSSPIIQDNLIINNEAINSTGLTGSGGGGIRSGDGNPRILNNVINSNKGHYGGAIVLNWAGGFVKNNIIIYNSGGEAYGGGGIWVNHAGPSDKVIENNTIVGNSSAIDGGGILIYQGPCTIRNNIIWGNTASSGAQIRVRTGTPTVTYCDVQGGWSGSGNINSDPQFSDTVFILKEVSPCVDAGDSTATYNDREDPLLPGHAVTPSHGGLRNDMGSYGGSGASVLPISSTITKVTHSESFNPSTYILEQNYPNPFNPSTSIQFRLQKREFVRLKIITITGQEIETLVHGEIEAGFHSVVWKASAYSSGIYFYQLVTRSYHETKKMILLR